MKKYRHKVILWLAMFIATISVVPTSVFAVSGTVYFGPDGDTVTSGSEFYVDVMGNVPDPGGWYGGGATIRFTYDPAKLQFVGADDTGGAFRQNNNHNWDTAEAGVVYYRAQIYFNAPGVNNQKIIGARFKATGTGTTTLSFSPSTNVNDGPTTGTSKTFTILPATCPAGQLGTPPNCTIPAPSPTPKPTKTPTPTRAPIPSATPAPIPTPTPLPTTEVIPEPVIDSDGGLKIENVQTAISRQKNVITWSVNKPGLEPELSYGLSKSNMKNRTTVTKLTDGSFEANLKDIKSGTLYYFAIKAVTTDQLKSANYNGTFTSKGYPVQITVKQNGLLAPDAKVVIAERSFVANKNATITTELGDGTFEASVTPKGSASSYISKLVVKKTTIPQSGEPVTQQLVIDGVIQGTTTTQSEDWTPLVAGIGAIITGLAIIGFFIYRKKVNEEQFDTSIDSDLLMANYGNAIDSSRVLTPVPNLEVQVPAPIYEQPQEVPTQQAPYNTDAPDTSSYANTAYDAPPLPAAEATSFEPTDTQTESPVGAGGQEYTQNYNDINTVPYTPTSSIQQIDEQLSEELVAVESIGSNTNSTSEEAIYHPETGVLDIVHSNHPAAQPLQVQEVSENPATSNYGEYDGPITSDASSLEITHDDTANLQTRIAS